MPHKDPTDTKNLDTYGHAPLEWSRVPDELAAGWTSAQTPRFLGTVRPDGRPHSAGIGAAYHDDELYFVSGPETQKSRNLAANPACTMSFRLATLDVVLEGDAERITNLETLETVAAQYREVGWPAEVEGDTFTAPFSAPSAGPPPWHLYRVRVHTVFAVAHGEPHGATRWRFDS